ATERLAGDASLRALLVRANGRAFCVGGGVDDFAAAGDALPGYLEELVSLLHAAVARIDTLDVPVVGAVRGVAAGGGLSLACACDLVVAGESARFVVAYAGIGLSPDLGEPRAAAARGARARPRPRAHEPRDGSRRGARHRAREPRRRRRGGRA